MSSLTIMQEKERAQAAAQAVERAFYDLGVEIEAVVAAVEAAGADPMDVAGAELLEEIEVTWGLWGEISHAIDALKNGTAALVEYESDRWGVVPTSLLEGLSGHLSGWFVWVGAVAALVAVISAWYLADYYLEIRDAEAKARQTHNRVRERYQDWLRDLCERDPERCDAAINAYEATFRAPPEEVGGAGGVASSIAAGSSGLAIGILVAMFALSKKGK